MGAGVVLTLAEWARWPQVEQELWLSAGDRVRRATAALHGTASGGGVAEVLAPIDGGESMLRRHLEARADRVEELARGGGGVVARAEPTRRPVALRSGLAPDLFRLGV